MKLLICGSRTWTDPMPIRAAILEVGRNRYLELIHGAARGADSLAADVCREVLPLTPVHVFPADWQRLGRRAGYVRNAEMLRQEPDLVWAFVDKPLVKSKGTAMMVDLARKAGVPVYVTEWLGSRVA